MKCIRHALAALTLLAASHAQAAPYTVIDPTQPVAGLSQRTLAENWWQWVMAAPQSANPVADPDGRFAGLNNNGPVFFLAGSGGERNITVPAGKPIFFPMLNGINVSSRYFNETYCPDEPDAMGCALFYISDWMNNVVELHATANGENVAIYPSHRQTSTGFFEVTAPEDDLFGWPELPAGTFPAVADGFWVAIEGLPIGQHTVTFGGTWGWGQTLHMVDHLNVIPEPHSGLVLLAALGALAATRRRPGGATNPQS